MNKDPIEDKVSLSLSKVEDAEIVTTEQNSQSFAGLQDTIYQLKEKVELGVEAYNSLTKQKEEIDTMKQEIERLSDIVNDHKNNAIPIMALFFGIFAFISIDLQFTTTLFSENSFLNQWTEGKVILAFLTTQILFFISIGVIIYCICKRSKKPKKNR